MSEHSTPEERTELPTDRRMGELRKEGSIYASTEVVQVVSLIAGFWVLGSLWTTLYTKLQVILIKSYSMIENREPMGVAEMHRGFVGLLLMMGPPLIILIFCVAAAASLTQMIQTDWNVKEDKIKFKWNFLNPINGIKKIFSVQGFITVGKALLKLALILPIAYYSLKAFAPHMVMLVHMGITPIFQYVGKGMHSLFWKILYVLIAMAIFDYVQGKWSWFRFNKMTRDEVKDERKAIEGDETTKRKIINKGLARIMQRIMANVPQADVVVTNPTHYSVALKYDRATMGAPTVVAKGRGFLALRIREIAKAHKVPILERKPLARALYASVEVGSEVPRDLFKAVAEVLAYVYRLKNPRAYMQKPTTDQGRAS